MFDVGAHTGDISRLLATRCRDATIHAFEPVPDTYKRLANGCGRRSRVVPHHSAIGDSIGTVLITTSSCSETNRIVQSEHAVADGQLIASVPCITLDETARSLGLSEVAFVKVDTEGHELSVLAGARQLLQEARIDLILIECTLNRRGAPHCDVCEILTVMRRYHYDVLGVYSYAEGRFIRGVGYCNVLFGRRNPPSGHS